MSCLGVVGYGEGDEGCAGLGAQIPDWFIAVGVEASSLSWRKSGVFDPELEAAICAD
jgi:hypothetical protein